LTYSLINAMRLFFANCTQSGVVVSSDVAGSAVSPIALVCISFLASFITYGLRSLPDFGNLTGATTAGVPVSMVDGSVSNTICEDCRREIVFQYLIGRICALVDMASKEDAFIQEHFPFAMPTSEQRTSGDVYDEHFFPGAIQQYTGGHT
jgi:hypothetical protein